MLVEATKRVTVDHGLDCAAVCWAVEQADDMEKLELGAVAEALRPGVEYPPGVAALLHRMGKLGQRLGDRQERSAAKAPSFFVR